MVKWLSRWLKVAITELSTMNVLGVWIKNSSQNSSTIEFNIVCTCQKKMFIKY